MKFLGKFGNGPVNKRLNFGGDPDHCLDTRIVLRIRHYWDIRKVVKLCTWRGSLLSTVALFLFVMFYARVVVSTIYRPIMGLD